MRQGRTGIFVVPWTQCNVNGLRGAAPHDLVAGGQWSWTGHALRIDGPDSLLVLGQAADDGQPLLTNAPRFAVTCGRKRYDIALILRRDAPSLAVFHPEPPPMGVDLWVVEAGVGHAPRPRRGRTICFTPGTMINTPDGLRSVESLAAGDQVHTRDGGAQPVKWAGARRVGGAALQAMPALRPVHIAPGALGADGDGLTVSPAHRILLRGDAARALFNSDEVLAQAGDLIGLPGVRPDYAARQVTYVHLLLDSHHVITAGGLASETFLPTDDALADLLPDQRAAIAALDLGGQPPGRRCLSPSETALLHPAFGKNRAIAACGG